MKYYALKAPGGGIISKSISHDKCGAWSYAPIMAKHNDCVDKGWRVVEVEIKEVVKMRDEYQGDHPNEVVK